MSTENAIEESIGAGLVLGGCFWPGIIGGMLGGPIGWLTGVGLTSAAYYSYSNSTNLKSLYDWTRCEFCKQSISELEQRKFITACCASCRDKWPNLAQKHP